MTQPPSSDLTLPDGVRVVAGRGGLLAVQVDVPACRGEVYLHGGHVTSWSPLGREVLWLSRDAVFKPGTAIRGGVPICFPWFAGGPDGGLAPAHGFARTTEWALVGATTDGQWVELILALTDSEQTRAQWPHSFAVDYRVRMGEDELALLFTVTNTGDAPFTFEEALHSYFAVEDIRSTEVDGLEGASYLDMVPGADRGPHVLDGPITFTGETDRTFQSTGATAVIRRGPRSVTVARDGSSSAIVWNPWVDKAAAMADFGDDEWTGMVCVETANVKADAVTLEPGATHTMTAYITI
ncbi:D-hexose-6-phosphate mutarotase [Nakamurella multipartita]|uniref:Putative glucose-6-phosphate 1-epimerase n=1 Tax=Nakamurella multipartita (strain ATCC 700099 / DSM 44233 / CIP 104796 / JCM 9543 / NBRC 105858 / Y-104) TaxID=479431 RepID=C8X8Z8_NAKMY|nr:D-hexose-6-phosphate mutarotase [Nakamurella multipartita]ACV81096.1 Aldose 1-epimerase [Nakamurella multipartita DSM 44233]